MPRQDPRQPAALLSSFAARVVGEFSLDRSAAPQGVFLRWREIVGAAAAAYIRPVEFQWPRKGTGRADTAKSGATLVVAVDGARAMEAQFALAAVIEAVNAHLGWRCVHSIAIRQVGFAAADPPARPDAADPSIAVRVKGVVRAVADDDLRDAMQRLGVRVGAAAAKAAR